MLETISAVPRAGWARQPLEQGPKLMGSGSTQVAVLIPCLNEEESIGQVVRSFRETIPDALVYVYDNNSTDRTTSVASEAGAIVRSEGIRGKGNVVRRMFADVNADIYILADGDMTYDASAASQIVHELIGKNLDMVVATRVGSVGAFPSGHRAGNKMFNALVSALFGPGFRDILSGYRGVSRRFAKSFPASSSGFEVETELSIHALDLKLSTAELPIAYGSRPENSRSKLRPLPDGIRILLTIIRMYKALKPFRFFGIIAIVFAIASVLTGAPIVLTYLETGLVPRLPTAVLAATLMQLSFLALTCGIITDAVSAARRELKRMRYLALPAPASEVRSSGRCHLEGV